MLSSLLVLLAPSRDFLSLMCNPLILLNVDLRSRKLSRQLIPANDDFPIRIKVSINVFEGSVRSFGIEQVGNRNERCADDSVPTTSVCPI